MTPRYVRQFNAVDDAAQIVTVERVEAKAKLSRNRSADDQTAVMTPVPVHMRHVQLDILDEKSSSRHWSVLCVIPELSSSPLP